MHRSNPRLPRRVASLVVALAATASVLVAGASPAHALPCVTDGHAYLTQPGNVYFSGFNGDESLGVRNIIVEQGDMFRVGGNGIRPGSTITFSTVTATGTVFHFLTGQVDYDTQPAPTHCVVNEEGPYRVVAPPGHYRIFARFIPGNVTTPGGAVDNHVVNIEVRRGPQTAGVTQSSTNSFMATVPSDPGGGGGDPGGGCDPRRPCQL